MYLKKWLQYIILIRKMNNKLDSYDKEVAVTLLSNGSANLFRENLSIFGISCLIDNVPICFTVTEAVRWRILAGNKLTHAIWVSLAGERLGNAGGHTPALLILSTS